MSKKALIGIFIGWCILRLIEYYYIPYFVLPLLWIIEILVLLVFLIQQIRKLITERKSITILRIANVIVFAVLFWLTFDRWHTDRVIEKMDWAVLYNKRMEIVKQVKNKELSPNVSWNGWVCELPFEFPVVSNGGNDVGISRNKDDGSVTVTFWVFRNFFNSPSTHFIYTNNKEKIEILEQLILNKPKDNWKIKENWYRTFTD